MKTSKAKKAAPAASAPRESGIRPWHYTVALAAALFLVFQVYGPALHGPFLFDDTYLLMNRPEQADLPLRTWVSGVRPMLMFTYWVNYKASGLNTFSYHAWNVLFHFVNSALIFFIVRRLVRLGGSESDLLALFAAALFLLHPVQSESVAYIAGRSESLTAVFFFSAYAIFLYRPRPAISWTRSVAVLALFAAALASKEHAVVLPALLILTDYFWNPGFRFSGIVRNWRLYAPMVVGALAGAIFVLRRVVAGALTAGFGMKDVTWTDYLFTQFRVIFSYFRLYLVPIGQNVDYDYPLSRSLMDRGAIFGLIAIAALVAAAWIFRKRFPLASFGLLAFLLILSPTSSVVPIKDPIAERRLYLPMIGLLMMTVELLRHVRLERRILAAVLGAILTVSAAAAYQRNTVWSDGLRLWQDTVAKAPRNPRAQFQLAYTNYTLGRCQEALTGYEAVAKLEKPDSRLLLDWALAHDCLNQLDAAMAKLQQAEAIEKTGHIYSTIGMIHAKAGRPGEAWKALETAVQLDPQFDMAYVYRGHLLLEKGDSAGAATEYRRALSISPRNQYARDALAMVVARPTN